ncbi:peptide transporter Ptr2p [[Candida] anglica]|uniref:Peptide transporter Ptr2p n=1 Tax=[Candida] anglica TaxID=148631 RepID=A0ABP0EHH7_9ASCO
MSNQKEVSAFGVTSSHELVSSNSNSIVEDNYDFEDPNNYFTFYVDELNPKGLRKPTPTETKTLRRVLGHAPYAVYLLCLIELAERGSYYGVQGCLANFVQRPLPAGNNTGAPPKGSEQQAGALGLGLQASSAITNLLGFLAYVVPLYGGFIADTKLGKFKSIWIGVIVGAISHILFIIASIPSVIESGHAIAPTVIAVISLAIGTGFIKPNLLPLLMDQYPVKIDVVKVLPSGENVIVDRQKSLERMTLVFYWAINIGAFLQLATSYCERLIGFWLAFLVPGIVYMLLPIVLFYLQTKVSSDKPKGTVIENAWKISRVTFRKGWISRMRSKQLWEYARPSKMLERGEKYYKDKKQSPITWDDQWVLDIKQTFNSCKIFIWFPIFNINDGGIGNIQTSQAGSMYANGVPNDLYNNFNPLTIIVLIPILDYFVYPTLRKYKIDFKPVYRITFGFALGALSQVVGAIIQYYVYQTSPCGYYATNCDVGDLVSPISAWVDIILPILQASGECFANTTAYELAYTRSPPQMKGLVMALFLFTSAISSAISLALTATLVDPHLIWSFGSMGIIGAVAAAVFFFQFRFLHVEMEEEAKIREEMAKYSELPDYSESEEKYVGLVDEKNLVPVTSIKSAVGK